MLDWRTNSSQSSEGEVGYSAGEVRLSQESRLQLRLEESRTREDGLSRLSDSLVDCSIVE